jgi:hypothetical protein
MNKSLVSRRAWLQSTGAITFAATSWAFDTNGGEPGDEIVKLKQYRNLFFDDSLIESRRGVVRTIHPAKKHARPVLVADQPWEGKIASVFVVEHLPERNLYQMWGQCYPSKQGFIFYAESRDGVQW